MSSRMNLIKFVGVGGSVGPPPSFIHVRISTSGLVRLTVSPHTPCGHKYQESPHLHVLYHTHTHTHTHARTHAHTHTHHSLPMLEGHTTSEALQNVRDRIWPILKANWALWPAVQVTVTQCSLIPKLQEGRLGMSHY